MDGNSQDILGLSELLWCTEILCHREWHGEWQVPVYPGTVSVTLVQVLGYSGTVQVTLVYRDTLPQRMAGWMASRGISQTVRVTWCKSWDIQGLPELLWCTEILCHRGWLGQVLGCPRTGVVKEGGSHNTLDIYDNSIDIPKGS